MVEREEPRLPINQVAEDLRTSDNPLERVFARSIKEIYTSGEYGMAFLRGSSTDSYELEALRVITRRQDKLEAFYATFTRNKSALRRLASRIHGGMQTLPRNVPHEFFSILRGESLRRVQEAGLQTIAALEVATSRETHEELFRIIYPKVLMGVSPAEVLGTPKEMFAVPERQQRDLAMAISFNFLKTIPFERRDITVTIPRHR